jgi:hypothetical protein
LVLQPVLQQEMVRPQVWLEPPHLHYLGEEAGICALSLFVNQREVLQLLELEEELHQRA